VLDALAATRADLAALPEVPVPPDIAAGWMAALAAQTGPDGPEADDPAPTPAAGGRAPTSGGRAPTSGGRAPTSGGGRARPAGARRPVTPRHRARVVLVAVAVLGVLGAGPALLGPAPTPGAVPVRGIDLATAGTAALGTTDVGALADPARRAACLRVTAPALPPDTALLGGRRVLLDDRPGVLLVLPGGLPGRLRLVVVDPGCGPDGGTLLAETTVGR
jgi:hypothetical protein